MTKYVFGVMRFLMLTQTQPDFNSIVDRAVKQVEDDLSDVLNLQVDLFDFPGPRLSTVNGAYAPLEFLQIGLSEKLERSLHFLLIVTEEELSTNNLSYVLALPSQLTNIGIISTRRLSPVFWGYKDDPAVTTRRLASLMLHTIGHLLNLDHHKDSDNIMYDFQGVEELEKMVTVTPAQVQIMHERLPIESHEAVARHNRARFFIGRTIANLGVILNGVRRSNPLALIPRLPTMLTAAISVMVVLFFSSETWDVSSAFSFLPLSIFSLIAILVSAIVLYRAFRIGPNQSRGGLPESVVVTAATTALTLTIVNLVIYVIFFIVAYLSAAFLFPEPLKQEWTTIDPSIQLDDHIKIGMFLAAMGVLTGSLGGRSDSKSLIRHILFLDEET